MQEADQIQFAGTQVAVFQFVKINLIWLVRNESMADPAD